MTVANRSILFPFLREIDAAPQKGLSQNFLVDANIVRKIASHVEIAPNTPLLEIGPGPGALTQELLSQGARVIAVEKDPRFAQALRRFQTEDRLTVYEDDILTIPLQPLVEPYAPLQVIANLPYHITTPILERLCDNHALFSSALIMVQTEVADRILAKPHTKAIGSFTIFLNTYATPKRVCSVSRSCFYPAPNVDSTVVKLEFHPPVLPHPRPFLDWVRKAYQQRRKMLRSTLSIEGFYADKRPETLSLEEWVALYREQGIVSKRVSTK